MGNIVRGRKTQDRIKAERTLVTVRAAGAFKSKVTSVNNDLPTVGTKFERHNCLKA